MKTIPLGTILAVLLAALVGLEGYRTFRPATAPTPVAPVVAIDPAVAAEGKAYAAALVDHVAAGLDEASKADPANILEWKASNRRAFDAHSKAASAAIAESLAKRFGPANANPIDEATKTRLRAFDRDFAAGMRAH